jgi:N-acetyltransferase 10
MTMDVHARFRTEAHQDLVPRFNERFLLSLTTMKMCAVCDDELNVLPISKYCRNIKPVVTATDDGSYKGHATSVDLAVGGGPKESEELKELKISLAETQPVGALVNMARTLDQAHAILTFAKAVSDKSLRNTVSLTAARGRGKSAALGISIASAVAYSYSNIFVTAPTPENLKTVFEFIIKALIELKFAEHTDFEVIQSTNPEFNKAVVRINIFRDHRQTVQYVQPNDHAKLAQAELLCIDEAAAIPLPLVKKLLGPYVVFLSSTVNGYEGTGRSLSLKLLAQLRRQQSTAALSAAAAAAADVHGNTGKKQKKQDRKVHEERWKVAAEAAAQANADGLSGGGSGFGGSGGSGGGSSATGGGRVLKEVTLETPIRYASGDPVEAWLNSLLCLDAGSKGSHRLVCGTPAPQDCQLYYVDRDALFSAHRLSEAFLQRMMALYVASHYKNQPNDLQLMSDAPAHHLFVLLGPTAEEDDEDDASDTGVKLPDILCVIQVALEGEVSRGSVLASISRGLRPSGDLIPWTVAQQFQDDNFAQLSGARVVRVACHPDVQRMGYGTRALQLLRQYYEGELSMPDLEEKEAEEEEEEDLGEDWEKELEDADKAKARLRSETVKPRKKLPPLLVEVQSRPPERLHWIGTSFGLTQNLFNYWRKAGYSPVYVRQTANDITGEHTVVMINDLKCKGMVEAPAAGWLTSFVNDTHRRFLSLLAFEFQHFSTTLALSVLDARPAEDGKLASGTATGADTEGEMMEAGELGVHYLPHDIKRLHAYSKNLVDFHMIVDLLPTLAKMHFQRKLPLPSTRLSKLQEAILLGAGLQHKKMEQLQKEVNVPMSQLLALFNKSVRKLCSQVQ